MSRIFCEFHRKQSNPPHSHRGSEPGPRRPLGRCLAGEAAESPSRSPPAAALRPAAGGFTGGGDGATRNDGGKSHRTAPRPGPQIRHTLQQPSPASAARARDRPLRGISARRRRAGRDAGAAARPAGLDVRPGGLPNSGPGPALSVCSGRGSSFG